MTEEERKLVEHKAQGARNKHNGDRFERRLDRAFVYYKAREIAYIQKTPEPMKVLRSLGAGKFVACFAKKGQADYAGTMTGGYAAYLEAKFTETDRIEQDRVEKHQADFLDMQANLGASCSVVCGFGSGEIYRVPWNTWKGMKEIWGRKFVTETDLWPYRCETDDAGIPLVLG